MVAIPARLPLPPSPLTDRLGRTKRKLRISITDRCNLRCPYCMPEKPQWLPKSDLLSAPQIGQLARFFVAEMGIQRIRLTGGEPLLRPELPQIISALQDLREQGLERVSLTSNGVRLARLAQALRDAGLDDVNVSLDARDPQRFARLSEGRYGLADVEAGIDAARRAGLKVKINSVIIRGYNETEVLPLARWARAADLELRYIEFMPLDGRGLWTQERVFSSAEIQTALATEFPVSTLARGHDPAAYFDLGAGQRIGIISTVSDPFCGDCDRLRLTATGELFSCLFGREGRPLRALLDKPQALEAAVRDTVWHKPAGYAEQPGYVERPVRMYQMGG